MDSTEKSMIAGALTTMGVTAAFEGYFEYMHGLGQTPTDFPFSTIHPAIPPWDTIIACAGTPLLLYALGKVMKKPKIVQSAKGGAVYGISELVGQTAYRVTTQVAPLRYYRVMVR